MNESSKLLTIRNFQIAQYRVKVCSSIENPFDEICLMPLCVHADELSSRMPATQERWLPDCDNALGIINDLKGIEGVVEIEVLFGKSCNYGICYRKESE